MQNREILNQIESLVPSKGTKPIRAKSVFDRMRGDAELAGI